MADLKVWWIEQWQINENSLYCVYIYIHVTTMAGVGVVLNGMLTLYYLC